jgi:hypothetical protein
MSSQTKQAATGQGQLNELVSLHEEGHISGQVTLPCLQRTWNRERN